MQLWTGKQLLRVLLCPRLSMGISVNLEVKGRIYDRNKFFDPNHSCTMISLSYILSSFSFFLFPPRYFLSFCLCRIFSLFYVMFSNTDICIQDSELLTGIIDKSVLGDSKKGFELFCYSLLLDALSVFRFRLSIF